MKSRCPRCYCPTRSIARFCGRCGFELRGDSYKRPPGQTPHSSPIPPPTGSIVCGGAVDLYATWESAWGGPLQGTEGVAVTLHNAGYALRHATLRFVGRNADGEVMINAVRDVSDVPRGRPVRLELASYEMQGPIVGLSIDLCSAEFAPGE